MKELEWGWDGQDLTKEEEEQEYDEEERLQKEL